jgi:GAF domain-containing protein
MQRRGESGQPVKERRTTTPKGRKAPIAPASTTDLQEQLDQRTQERDEALEQLAATSDVLQVISRSTFDLKAVLQGLVESAARLCNADKAGITRQIDGEFFFTETYGLSAEFTEHVRTVPVKPERGTITGLALLEGRTIHVSDLPVPRDEIWAKAQRLGGFQTMLGVPMMREGTPIGVIALVRTEVQPFTERQIKLVQNFAAQAVIAIENARLLNELHQRTSDLSESLEQQTATSEVLKVISSSPGELKPVFESMLENAVRICQASFGNLLLYENDAFRHVALHNAPQAWAAEQQRDPVAPRRLARFLYHVADTKRVNHIADIVLENPEEPIAKVAGARTLLIAPMLKEDNLVGVIAIYRQEVLPFTDKQIELVKNFANQAVIAIENTRLLKELRESLQQQTATADVLKVISSSPGELRPVFQAVLAKATDLCEASYGGMWLCEGNAFRAASHHGDLPTEFVDPWRSGTLFQPSPNLPMVRAIRARQPIQIADLRDTEVYREGYPMTVVAADVAGIRSLIAVPMFKEKEPIGVLSIYRKEVRPFTDKHIELVTNFAAQAVIAIENARLLNELHQRTSDLSESLEQQMATSEVLQVISSSPGALEPVFTVMLDNAVRICEAKFGALFLFEGDAWRAVALHSAAPPLFIEARQRHPVFPIIPGTALGRVTATKQVVQIADVRAESAYLDSSVKLGIETGDIRTVLSVPMLKEGELVGAFHLFHHEVRQFTDKQIELVKNFAAQAVIAIENSRLLNDLNKLNQQLEQRVADQVGEIERMGKLRRFLPPQVADLIVASGAEKQLESHRREITALFCDLRGFTGFSESSDPEDVIALLREYHAAIGEIINKYGGTLERYAGDGVMVVFNDPIPVDNPALQAVLMAIDMRAAIGALIEKWRKLGHDIGFGIGIAHGFATLGTIGFEGRFDYAAIGTVSNVASRLCDEAKPGQILISPRVLMAVEKDITVEPVGDFALKGIRRPLAAYNVLATKVEN